MTSAALDRLLAVLMVSLAATGLVSLRAGHASDAWRLTPPEASRALLATGVAGVRLPVPNGAPCRLVVPDHRGLDWIKWVTEIEAV